MPSIDVARQNGNPTFASVTVGNITAKGDLSLNSYANNVTNEGIRINTSGSVGIGNTSAPIRTLDVGGSQALHNQSVFTYRFSKSFTENTTGVNFFSVTLQASHAASVYVYLGSSNAATGAFLSQIYQYTGGVYYGGWSGAGAQVAVTSAGSGVSSINGASINGSGVITFTCSTSNNGTGTSNNTWAYIIVSDYATGANPSATVL